MKKKSDASMILILLIAAGAVYLLMLFFSTQSTPPGSSRKLVASETSRTGASGSEAPPSRAPQPRYQTRVINKTWADKFLKEYPDRYYVVAPGVVRLDDWTCTKEANGSWVCKRWTIPR